MSELPAPNHTQTPNAFYDELLCQINSLSELKVTLAMMRLTFGWHKREDRISLSQLEKLTGLSRESVCEGIKHGMERKTVLRRPAGQGFIYRLNVSDELVKQSDQSTIPTSQEFRPELVKQSDPQKKGKKTLSKKQKERTAVSICRERTGRTPQPKQRDAINAKVTDLDRWDAIVTKFALEGQPPHRVDWMLERYEKARGSPVPVTETREEKQTRLQRLAEQRANAKRPDRKPTPVQP